MDIVHVASEVEPFSKTGGLADVAGALPRALAAQGARVTVITPLYDRRLIDQGRVRPTGRALQIDLAGRILRADVLESVTPEGARVLHLAQPALYEREGLYQAGGVDHPDNALRFAFLCHAALALVRRWNLKPDVLHAHDWQTALVPFLMRHVFGGFVDTVLTLHNLGYQGLFPRAQLPDLGVGEPHFHPGALEYWGQINLLKGGLVSANALTTVSPRYAQEITTPALGHGLDGVLAARGGALHGILNGIDPDQWDPRHDPHLAAAFGPDDVTGKARCRDDLAARMGLGALPPGRALLGIVSRFADQKGFDLLFQALPALLERDVALVALGTGEPAYEQGFEALARAHPERVAVRVAFDEALAHQIEGGADLFLMPSRYEPCGLNQMYSMRYGTVPVVHETGGLADTVPDADRDPAGTGFSFAPPDAGALLDAVDRALLAFSDPTRWRTLQIRGMTRDFSWASAARSYLDLYRALVDSR